MTHRRLSVKEVARIRGSWNPDKAYAPGVANGDLMNKTYLELVEAFQKRINEWYFDTAESFASKVEHHNFPIIIFCVIIIDLLSQYVEGIPSHTEKCFTNFIRTYLCDHYSKLNKPIISCRYYENNWHKEKIKDIPAAFYHCFRSGVVHSGRILEYGRINELYPQEIFKYKEWEKGKYEIVVHTTGLLKELRRQFDCYIVDLKSARSKHKKNFALKFYMEYGINPLLKDA